MTDSATDQGTPGVPVDGLRRPRVLCVGAYERDNFGDLLFQMVTAPYLAGMDVVYAAPFAADMTELTGLDVPAFGPLLDREQFDAVWTVGGEVGGTSVEYAYWAARGSAALAAYRAAGPQERVALLAEHHGEVPIESPYLPRVSAYPRNRLAASVLNSVGLTAVGALPPARKAGTLGILREATRISVRDRRASALLAEEGIAHTLDPDLVHAIALSRPRPDTTRGDYVLLQISEKQLRTIGVDSFARTIIGSAALRGRPVRLFSAGTAPGHDSLELYAELRDAVRAIDPARPIEVSATLDPWERVDEIAAATLWIGSSLHGRIVACAYGVPRVSLAKRKLDEYAQTWDPDMPWGIDERTLDAAAAKALALGATGTDDRGRSLAAAADANIRAAVAHVQQWVADGPPPGRIETLLDERGRQWSRLLLELAKLEEKRKAEAATPARRAPAPRGLRRVRSFLGRLRRRIVRSLPRRGR